MKVNLERVDAGTVLDLFERIWDLHSAGMSLDDAFSDVMADEIIQKYRPKIAAALRAKGVPIEDDDTLDGPTLLRIVNERAGLEIAAWTPDAVRVGLDAYMSRRLSAVLGVEVASVQDIAAVKQSLLDAAGAAVVSGRANHFISKMQIKKMRVAKAWKDGGVPVEDRAVTLSRWYQKKYRRTHKGVWRDAGEVPINTFPGHS